MPPLAGGVQRGSATVTVFSQGVECSCFLSLVLPSLLDRLGDSKDSVREQDQTLLLKIMEQAANPQVCSTALHSMSDWLCKKRKPFSVRFSLPFFCLKWLHLPTPCYKIFALLGKAVAWQDNMGVCQWISQAWDGYMSELLSQVFGRYLFSVSMSIVLGNRELL